MIPIRVTRGGETVAVVQIFGHHVYDRHGWPRAREEPGESPGYVVTHGALPPAVVADLRDAVLRSPVCGMLGDYLYRIDDPEPPSPPPRRSARRRRWAALIFARVSAESFRPVRASSRSSLRTCAGRGTLSFAAAFFAFASSLFPAG
jgi:hypothetical protein